MRDKDQLHFGVLRPESVGKQGPLAAVLFFYAVIGAWAYGYVRYVSVDGKLPVDPWEAEAEWDRYSP
jgi:hypothetical protein